MKFIDGYPGKYVILARRAADRWYVVGVNAENQPLKQTITLPMFAPGSALTLYSDDAKLNGSVKTVKQNKKQQLMPSESNIRREQSLIHFLSGCTSAGRR